MMVGREFVLHPTCSAQVAFQGRVIAQASSPKDDAKLRGRSHTITIYESTQGEILASIEFQTTASHELDFCLVETSLSLSEISDFLASQDPTEHIDRNRLRAHSTSEADRLIKANYHDYDALCIEIERQLRTFVPSRSEAPIDSHQKKEKSGWSSWNPFA